MIPQKTNQVFWLVQFEIMAAENRQDTRECEESEPQTDFGKTSFSPETFSPETFSPEKFLKLAMRHKNSI